MGVGVEDTVVLVVRVEVAIDVIVEAVTALVVVVVLFELIV